MTDMPEIPNLPNMPNTADTANTLYRLEVESLHLGTGIRSVGLALIVPETREPVKDLAAARLWAAIVSALAAEEPWSLDFFAHLERVREFCRLQDLAFREPNAHALVIAGASIVELGQEKLSALLERFAGETFGARAGKPVVTGDADVEGSISRTRGRRLRSLPTQTMYFAAFLTLRTVSLRC